MKMCDKHQVTPNNGFEYLLWHVKRETDSRGKSKFLTAVYFRFRNLQKTLNFD